MSAKFYRKERLEKQLAQIINETMLYKMNDVRVQSQLVNVTRVELSDEMHTATVYISVLGKEQKNKIIKTLYNSKHFFRHAIMQKLSMKAYPELKFFVDEKEKKVTNTLNLINRLAKEMNNNKIPDNKNEDNQDEERNVNEL